MDLLFEGVEVAGTTRRPGRHRGDVNRVRQQGRRRRGTVLLPPRPPVRRPRLRRRRGGAGAVGLMVERPLPLPVPQVVVAPGSARRAMAQVACTFYDNPARSLMTIGVTGTNGKTTVTHLLAVDPRGERGAVRRDRDPRRCPDHPGGPRGPEDPRRRTPSGAGGGGHGGLLPRPRRGEGRRHPFRRRRVHQPEPRPPRLPRARWSAYFAAKASLFTEQRAALAVVNVDDEWGRRLLERLDPPHRGVLVGRRHRRRDGSGTRRRSSGGAGRSNCRSRASSTSPTPWPRRPAPPPSVSPRTRWCGASSGPDRCPAASS